MNSKGRVPHVAEIGQPFGLWTVTGPTYVRDGHVRVPVMCICGRGADRQLSTLEHGRSKSCRPCAFLCPVDRHRRRKVAASIPRGPRSQFAKASHAR